MMMICNRGGMVFSYGGFGGGDTMTGTRRQSEKKRTEEEKCIDDCD